MHSLAGMHLGELGSHPCIPGGILRLLDAYDVDSAGTHAVVVRRRPILGGPVGMLLLGRGATVTHCHSRTSDLADHVRRADIAVAAVGKAELIRGDSPCFTCCATSSASTSPSVPSRSSYSDETSPCESSRFLARWCEPESLRVVQPSAYPADVVA
jgi:hypothetical protein